MDFTALSTGLAFGDPYSGKQYIDVIPGKAFLLNLILPRLEISGKRLGRACVPVEVKVDGWPDKAIGAKLFVRIGSQGIGCDFDCLGCDAADLPGYNLEVKEIVFQVVHALLNERVPAEKVQSLTIAFFGTGENGMNGEQVAEAIEVLHRALPEAVFVVSSSGPKKLGDAIVRLKALIKKGIAIDLQISLPYPREAARKAYLRKAAKAAVSVEELGWFVCSWEKDTGRKVHINVVVGSAFKAWSLFDFLRFWWHFPPEHTVTKISVEGKHPGSFGRWLAFIRLWLLRCWGYKGGYIYDPPGNDVGAGCASLELIQVKPAKIS